MSAAAPLVAGRGVADWPSHFGAMGTGHLAAVVAMRVLKYVSDTPSALSEIARVAEPGAPVVFDAANGRSLARFGYVGPPMGFVTRPRSGGSRPARDRPSTLCTTGRGFRMRSWPAPPRHLLRSSPMPSNEPLRACSEPAAVLGASSWKRVGRADAADR